MAVRIKHAWLFIMPFFGIGKRNFNVKGTFFCGGSRKKDAERKKGLTCVSMAGKVTAEWRRLAGGGLFLYPEPFAFYVAGFFLFFMPLCRSGKFFRVRPVAVRARFVAAVAEFWASLLLGRALFLYLQEMRIETVPLPQRKGFFCICKRCRWPDFSGFFLKF